MKIGVQTLFNGEQREPLADYLAGVAKTLEERSFSSIWVSKHVVTFPKYGQGWAGFRMTPVALAGRLKVLKRFLAEQDRTIADIDIVVSPADKPCDKSTLAQALIVPASGL